jgi:hypothetical protein
MSQEKRILILANSKRPGGYCVAGKEVLPAPDGTLKVGGWIRLFITTNALVGVAGLSAQFDTELATVQTRMETIMQRPALLRPWPNDPQNS